MGERFRNLTVAQERVFGQITMGNDLGHNPRTTTALESLGLVESFTQEIRERGQLPLLVRRFDVPLPVHAEWCAWCAEQPDPAELEEAKK